MSHEDNLNQEIGAMPIPDFTEHGVLPQGQHRASWPEFYERFAHNDVRAELLNKLAKAGRILRHAGCTRLWINGSLVTSKVYPNDVDVLYNAREVRPDQLTSEFRNRVLRQALYGGDYFAIDMDHHDPLNPEGLMQFFQTDRDGQAKGIVVLSLSTLPTALEV